MKGLALFLLISLPVLHASDESLRAVSELKAFPAASAGMTRSVITVPFQVNEDLLQVELLLGKTVLLDADNRYFFAGRIEEESIPGWGYEFFILRSIGPMAGTLMAVDPNAPKVARFIMISGEPKLHRYNSRLPIVIYVPTGVEVRYRIWRADQKIEIAPRG